MATMKLRKEVHGLIDQADDTILKMIHAMLKEYSSVYYLTPEQEEMLEERRKNHLSGKSKSYTIEEAKIELKKLRSRK